MWTVAADVAGGDGSQPIVVALIAALGGVLTTAVGALVSVARRESREPSPAPLPSLGERVAVLERRANDTDDALDLQDRRLDREERRMDDGHRRLAALEKSTDQDNNPRSRRD